MSTPERDTSSDAVPQVPAAPPGVLRADIDPAAHAVTIDFDPKTETHTGAFAKEANALLKDPNSPGFEVPSVGKV